MSTTTLLRRPDGFTDDSVRITLGSGATAPAFLGVVENALLT